MTPYLFYVFGRPGADDLYVLTCADDAEAREKAEWLLTLHPAASGSRPGTRRARSGSRAPGRRRKPPGRP